MPSPARLDIRSAHDIVAALDSPDLALRLALCQAAAAHPSHILAYGAAAGVDLIASFLRAAQRRESLLFRKATLGALVHFDDPRVVDLFQQVLLTSNESDVLRLAAKRVALDSNPSSRRFLRDRLLNEANALRVRCIAGALSATSELTQGEKLRLALASPGPAKRVERWPHDDPQHAEDWARELAGPFALLARRLLQSSGRTGDLLALLPFWSSWADADRAWFLDWGGALFGSQEPPHALRALLRDALARPTKAVALAALRWSSAFPDSLPRSALERLTSAADSDVRRAALAAMPAHSLDWWQIARGDGEPTVRALAIDRALTLAERTSFDAPASERPAVGEETDLASFIADSDWRVRAAVVRALNQRGPAAVELARGWLAHSNPEVRAGALQVLLGQGQERWLANTLLG